MELHKRLWSSNYVSNSIFTLGKCSLKCNWSSTNVCGRPMNSPLHGLVLPSVTCLLKPNNRPLRDNEQEGKAAIWFARFAFCLHSKRSHERHVRVRSSSSEEGDNSSGVGFGFIFFSQEQFSRRSSRVNILSRSPLRTAEGVEG